jgi:hypothetical protein
MRHTEFEILTQSEITGVVLNRGLEAISWNAKGRPPAGLLKYYEHEAAWRRLCFFNTRPSAGNSRSLVQYTINWNPYLIRHESQE